MCTQNLPYAGWAQETLISDVRGLYTNLLFGSNGSKPNFGSHNAQHVHDPLTPAHCVPISHHEQDDQAAQCLQRGDVRACGHRNLGHYVQIPTLYGGDDGKCTYGFGYDSFQDVLIKKSG